MKKPLIALAALVAGAVSSAQALAHHSFAAEFDANAPILLNGTVLKVDWTNPHVYFFIEVETEAGDYEEWALEMGSPNGLMRRGWTRDTLAIGEEVIVRGTRARDGSFKGNAQTVMIAASCQRLFAASSQDDFNEANAPDPSADCDLAQ